MFFFEDASWRPLGRLTFFSFLIIITFLVSSCAKNKHFDLQKEKCLNFEVEKTIVPEDVLLKQAKYSDIPFPIGYDFVNLAKNKQSDSLNISKSNNNLKSNGKVDVICYSGDLTMDKVVDYYRRSMDRCGWEIVDLSNEKEGLLFCNKVNRCCIVSIRDKFGNEDIKKNYVYLFIKNKLQDDLKTKDINKDIINAKSIDFGGIGDFLKKG